jgi:hypothetical protein
MTETHQEDDQPVSCRRIVVRADIAREHECKVVGRECVCQRVQKIDSALSIIYISFMQINLRA